MSENNTETIIIAVVPALNEEKTVSAVVDGVLKYVNEIIVVDDASSDRTTSIAKEKGAIILSHCTRQGYDKSLDDGFALASKRGASVIITFDADGQHNPEDVPRIVEPILKGEADVVVGKREHFQRITEYLFSLVARVKVHVHDPLCGLKAYHVKVYNDIGYFDRVSSIGTELMFRAKKRGYRIVQRNITINERKDESRIGGRIEANWKILKALTKMLFRG